MNSPQVLIVGAGPTGLVLALWLAKCGVRVRIIDKSEQRSETSRAMVVHARTLEFYRQLGIAEMTVSGGIRADHLTFRAHGRAIARMPFGDFGRGLSPYPFVLTFPQDDHERMLISQLEKAGVRVERRAEFLAVEQNDHRGVRARIKTERGEEIVESDYLCGCDGANSAVRRALKIGFSGDTYPQVFFVADALANGEAADAHGGNMCMSRDAFCIVFPVRSSGSFRLIGIVPPEHETREQFAFSDVADSVLANTQLAIEKINWFSTYHVHHRVADRFRENRIFLAGDAGHIHSPAGGQGMNTGIGDAVNLAWKLSAVVQERADINLLATYEPERLAFARTLVRSTDRMFRVMASRTLIGSFWRIHILPHLLGIALRFKSVPRQLFKFVSQIRIRYRASALSVGRAGKLRAGDRLPWLADDDADNFAPLTAIDWQLHIYGKARAELQRCAAARSIPVHVFEWTKRSRLAGFVRDACYLVRPDGHLAFVSPTQDDTTCRHLSNYLAARAIKPRNH